MTLGYIGLGKMGINMCMLLKEHGHEVVAWNRSKEGKKRGREAGLRVADSLEELALNLPERKIIWLMVSQGAVDEILKNILPMLNRGDILVDGGNCFYKDTIRRAKILKKRGIKFLDAGVSGGPSGARRGASIMVGGDKTAYEKILPIIKAASAAGAYQYLGSHGAGHFVKMVHNGIEYGMMQAIAEGFSVLKKSPFKLNLKQVAGLYNNRSVIESRLIGWLVSGFERFGEDLKNVSGSVAHTGEGEWAVKTAKKFGLPVKVIEDAFRFRVASAKNSSYAGKILSALRNQFGGHSVRNS